MITSDTVEVSVKYDRAYKFFLRLISIDEENKLRQKAFGLKEEERAEKEYQINVDMLCDLSVMMPEGIESIGNATSISDAIRDFFHQKTALKERIAFFAVRGFFLRIQPSDFF